MSFMILLQLLSNFKTLLISRIEFNFQLFQLVYAFIKEGKKAQVLIEKTILVFQNI